MNSEPGDGHVHQSGICSCWLEQHLMHSIIDTFTTKGFSLEDIEDFTGMLEDESFCAELKARIEHFKEKK